MASYCHRCNKVRAKDDFYSSDKYCITCRKEYRTGNLQRLTSDAGRDDEQSMRVLLNMRATVWRTRYSITLFASDNIFKMWKRQDGRCFFSRIPLTIGGTLRGKRRPTNVTPMKIDMSLSWDAPENAVFVSDLVKTVLSRFGQKNNQHVINDIGVWSTYISTQVPGSVDAVCDAGEKCSRLLKSSNTLEIFLNKCMATAPTAPTTPTAPMSTAPTLNTLLSCLVATNYTCPHTGIPFTNTPGDCNLMCLDPVRPVSFLYLCLHNIFGYNNETWTETQNTIHSWAHTIHSNAKTDDVTL